YHLLQLGAHAFLSKNSDVSEFESAIYSTVDKGFYRNQVMRDALRNAISVRPLNVTLTNREVMILELLCLGLTNKKIGLELSLSENTIRNHKVRIMRKAGVKNAVALVKFAVESGLIKNKIKPSD
ncbi:MAG: response regulator transcription factor, partial [Bacteroidota bacterium]